VSVQCSDESLTILVEGDADEARKPIGQLPTATANAHGSSGGKGSRSPSRRGAAVVSDAIQTKRAMLLAAHPLTLAFSIAVKGNIGKHFPDNTLSAYRFWNGENENDLLDKTETNHNCVHARESEQITVEHKFKVRVFGWHIGS
jgi:hypothetical protein